MSLRSHLKNKGAHFTLQASTSTPASLQYLEEERREDCLTCLEVTLPSQVILDTHELHLLNNEGRLLSSSSSSNGSGIVEILEADVNRDLEAPWRKDTKPLQRLALRWTGASPSTLTLPLHTRTLPPKAGSSSKSDLVEAVEIPPPRGFISCLALGAERKLRSPLGLHSGADTPSSVLDCSADAYSEAFGGTLPTHTLLSISDTTENRSSLVHNVPVGRTEDLGYVSTLNMLITWTGVLWLLYRAWESTRRPVIRDLKPDIK